MADNQQVTQESNHQTPEAPLIHNQEQSEQPPEPVNPLAEQFSRVVKQEKFIAEERKKIEEAKRAFETDKQEVEKYRALKGKDPFEILEHYGISYDALLEADKNRRTTPMDPMAKKALETVEQLRMQLESKEQEAQREKLSRAEIKLMSDINSTIRTHEYDLIEKLDEQASVRQYMEDKYAETGEIPDIKEACDAITERLATKFHAIKESKWLKPKEVAPVEVEEPKKVASLSNKMVQSSVSADKPMTDAERLKAAVNAMNAIKTK